MLVSGGLIGDVRAALRQRRDDHYWRTHTRDLIALAGSEDIEQLRGKYPNFVYWASFSAPSLVRIDPVLFSEYIETLSRLAVNFGNQGDSANHERLLAALDDAIDRQRAAGSSALDAYLAKNSYLETQYAENPMREAALEAAFGQERPGTANWIRAGTALAQYYTDTSRYPAAIKLTERILRDAMRPLSDESSCAIKTTIGVARFTSFSRLGVASELLTEVCDIVDRLPTPTTKMLRVAATAYHYRARIEEVNGNDALSIEFMLRAHDYQNRCPHELPAYGWHHLRLAELLTGVGLLDQADDHIRFAGRYFKACYNRSSGRLQTKLGLATIAAARGDFEGARTLIADAAEFARSVRFDRGELLCLGYLFALHLRNARWSGAARSLASIIHRTLSGQLRRAGIVLLLPRLPRLIPVALRRMAYRGRTAAGSSALTSCGCDLHATPRSDASPANSARQ